MARCTLLTGDLTVSEKQRCEGAFYSYHYGQVAGKKVARCCQPRQPERNAGQELRDFTD